MLPLGIGLCYRVLIDCYIARYLGHFPSCQSSRLGLLITISKSPEATNSAYLLTRSYSFESHIPHSMRLLHPHNLNLIRRHLIQIHRLSMEFRKQQIVQTRPHPRRDAII